MNTEPLPNIAVLGAAGRMGQMIIANFHNFPQFRLSAAVVHKANPALTAMLGGVCTTNTVQAIASSDIVIDVSAQNMAQEHSELAAQSNSAYVSGVTGLTEKDFEALKFAADHCPVLYAANFGFGLHAVAHLLKAAGRILGSEYDCDILDTHHSQKKDAPSGTALYLAESVQAGRQNVDQPTGKIAHTLRDGLRNAHDIGFAVRRQGGITGEHDVTFANNDEIITIGHRSLNRDLYARGALKVASWLYKKPAGFYTAADWVAESLA